MDTTSLTLLDRLHRPDDATAWSRFVELYAPIIYRWALHFGLQPADAADLVQDILAHLVRTLPSFRPRPGSRFRSWLWIVARNKYTERRRREARVHAGLPDDFDTPCPGDSAEQLSEQVERQFLIRRSLELLRPEFHETTWAAFWAVAIEQRPAEQVAAEFGLSTGAVYSAKFRVLRRLKLELSGLID